MGLVVWRRGQVFRCVHICGHGQGKGARPGQLVSQFCYGICTEQVTGAVQDGSRGCTGVVYGAVRKWCTERH